MLWYISLVPLINQSETWNKELQTLYWGDFNDQGLNPGPWNMNVVMASSLLIKFMSIFHLVQSSDKFRAFILDIEDLSNKITASTELNRNLKEDLKAMEAQVDNMKEMHSTEIHHLNQTISNLQHQLSGKWYYWHLLT